MTAPAPLDRAVAEARKARKAFDGMGRYAPSRLVAAKLAVAMEALLAALDADRGEAEAALKPFAAIGADATVAEMAALAESEPHAGHGKFGIMWRTHNDGGPIVIEAGAFVAAARYFARREEKGENRG